MLKSLRKALSIEDIRKRLLYTFAMLIVVRLGSQLPTPGVDPTFIQNFFAQQTGDAFNFFEAFTGGSFTRMSVFALSITPYITSSIIIQLLTIAIPKLEEMQKDGEDGRKKIQTITRFVTVALALIESIAMVIGFGKSGLIEGYSAMTALERVRVSVMIVAILTAGSTLLMWLGERITERGVGNGISIILVINIVSRLPEDFIALYKSFVKGQSVLNATIAIVVILAVVVGTILFTVLLCGGERRIPVQYSKKVQGRRTYGGNSSNIPLKVNTAGVIPVIFAQSLMTFPLIIMQIIKPNFDYSSVGGKIIRALSSNNWFNRNNMILTLGVILYIVLIVFFAYFYTSLTFNPLEIANNMKKSGGFIPGIRPGKATSDYLTKILNRIIFIGAIGLTVVALIPVVFSGLFNANVSFGGTSIIIIVGVILETIRQIESQMVVRDYKGFLNE